MKTSTVVVLALVALMAVGESILGAAVAIQGGRAGRAGRGLPAGGPRGGPIGAAPAPQGARKAFDPASPWVRGVPPAPGGAAQNHAARGPGRPAVTSRADPGLTHPAGSGHRLPPGPGTHAPLPPSAPHDRRAARADLRSSR
jgi:hypothetical protein